jgi:hypothetical protein
MRVRKRRTRKTRTKKRIGKRISRSTRRKVMMTGIRKAGDDHRVDRVRKENIKREENIRKAHLLHLNLLAEA